MKAVMLASGRSYHATRWANALVSRGIHITFVTLHEVVRPISERVTVVELPWIGRVSYVLNVRRVRSLVRGIKPDITHSHSAGGYGLLGALSGARPWILSLYGTDIYEFPRRSVVHKSVLKNILQRADMLLSTSHAMACRMEELYPELKRPAVTPFGVDCDLFRPVKDVVEERGVTKIGIVKKLEPEYGIDVLLKAFGILVREYEYGDRIELHIVGEGSERQSLLRLCSNGPGGDSVYFHGAIPNKEVPGFLNDLDIFVVPSRRESFGVAAVEACAVGLPVIVSDVGGLPEVIDDEETGIVVPRDNPEAFARAIDRLVQSPEERARLGAAGRKKVEAEYDWDKNVADMIEIYESLLARERSGGC